MLLYSLSRLGLISKIKCSFLYISAKNITLKRFIIDLQSWFYSSFLVNFFCKFKFHEFQDCNLTVTKIFHELKQFTCHAFISKP